MTGYRLVGALRYNPATPTYALKAGAAKVVQGHRSSLPVRSTGNTVEPVTGTVRVQRPARHAPGLGQGDADPAGQARVAAAACSTKGLTAGSYTATVTLRQGSKRFNVSKRITVRR